VTITKDSDKGLVTVFTKAKMKLREAKPLS
jgi:hypothetical protein